MPGEPMEAAQRSAEYVFQGIMYYFRREKVCPRYQFTLKDPVDPALLQQALDAALEAAPYYRVRLVWEKRKAFLEPNSEPCLVYPDSVMREMPEQTNGYFFALHCAQNTVYFDWFHFIADGHGVSPFLTRILELYCNLRYGTAFANPPIPCSPAYDIAKLVEQYPLQVMDETTMQREVVENKGWATDEELTDYFAIGQCTPGVIAVNTATFIGQKHRGIIGGIVATLGVVFPSLIIIAALAGVIDAFSHLAWVQHAFAGIRVCVCVLIFNAVLKLWKGAVKDAWGLVIFLAILALSVFTKLSPIIYVLAAAVAGLLIRNLGAKRS